MKATAPGPWLVTIIVNVYDNLIVNGQDAESH